MKPVAGTDEPLTETKVLGISANVSVTLPEPPGITVERRPTPVIGRLGSVTPISYVKNPELLLLELLQINYML